MKQGLIALAELRESATNPRKTFSSDGLCELAESIRSVGLLQALVVRPCGSHFEVICGARRLRAAKLAGLDRVPCLIYPAKGLNSLLLQITENAQRENIPPLEEAEAIQTLMAATGDAVDALAVRLGKSRDYLFCRLKLLELSPAVRQMMASGQLRVTQAVAIARLPDDLQEPTARRLLSSGSASVGDFESTARAIRESLNLPRSGSRRRGQRPDTVKRLAEYLSRTAFNEEELDIISECWTRLSNLNVLHQEVA